MASPGSKRGRGEVDLSVTMPPQLREAAHWAAARWGRRKGRSTTPAYVWERVVCWVLSLSDEDFDRIQAEGEPLVEEHWRGLDPEIMTPEGFRRRKASVFAAPSVPGPAKGGVEHPRPISASGRTTGGPGDQNPRRKRKADCLHEAATTPD